MIASFLMVLFASSVSFADYQKTIDECISAWGKSSPFKKGTPADKTITAGVKVFGIGKSDVGDSELTENPRLILIRPAVNVLGKSTIRLENPKGWYCFKSNVTVLGKISIEAHCHAHIANANEDGTSVLAADESDKGVAVLGSLRVTRTHCNEQQSN